MLLLSFFWTLWLFRWRHALFESPLEDSDDLNDSLTLDVCRVDKDGLVLPLHILQLFLLPLIPQLDMAIKFLLRLLLPAFLHIQKLDEQVGAIRDGIENKILNKANIPSWNEAILRQNKGNLSQFLQDRPWPDQAIIKEHLIYIRLRYYKKLLIFPSLNLLLDIYIKPYKHRIPKIFLIDLIVIQTPK